MNDSLQTVAGSLESEFGESVVDASKRLSLSGGRTETGEALVGKWQSVGGPPRELRGIDYRVRLHESVESSRP